MTGYGELPILAILLLCLCSTVQAATPVWPTTTLTANVAEDAADGFVVITFAATGATSYTINAASTSDFEIVTSSSDLTVKNGNTLDFETTTSYTLTIRADDGSMNIADATLTITVLDVIDEDPVITSTSKIVSVPEGNTIGDTVTFTGMTISDADVSDVLSYTLLGSDNSAFAVDYSSGVITIRVVLDYETKITYDQLLLKVTDKASLSATVSLTVSVTDINDVTPTCSPSVYYASVAENTAAGQSLVTLICSDTDSGSNGAFSASVFSGDPASTFTFSGLVLQTDSTATDYEATQKYELIVHLVDTPGLIGTATVNIQVNGVDDNNPTWGSWIPIGTSRTLDEDSPGGTIVFTAVANDLDVGTGGTITYGMTAVDSSSVDATSKFRLDKVSGAVTIYQPLDRDAGLTSYTLTVTADDGSGTPISKTFTLNLNDVNDNAPTFSQSIHQVTMSESAATASASIVQLSASDLDSSPSFSYSISYVDPTSVTSKIQMSGTTAGLLELASALDPDASDPTSIIVKVEVTDSATPPIHTATTTVQITITPINDNTPAFSATVPASPISVAESESVGTSVAKVAAPDADYGEDGDVEYSITGGNNNNAFIINKKTGEIQIQTALDYETEQSYDLVITATDKGTAPNSASATITFSITDVNDNPPICPSSITVDLAENAIVSHAVKTVVCTDGDGDTLQYTITSGNVGSAFDIGINSGAITLANTVNYDSATQAYNLQVDVTDTLSTETVAVLVNLTPVNDYTPSFGSAQTAPAVSESEPRFYSVHTYTAADLDYGSHGELTYAITAVTQSGNSLFSIDSGGVIRLLSPLDYDAPATKEYELTISATDGGGLVGTGTVTVGITDVNDNSPTCTLSATVVDIAENGPGSTVSVVSCSDEEDGSSLTLTLTESPAGSFFSLSGNNVVNAGGLDYETSQSHVLTLEAADTGGRTATSTIYVNVQNVNDGPPAFSGSFSVSLPESTSVGTSVDDVTATDPDGLVDRFGNPQYSIFSGDVDNVFTINPSGRVTTNGALDAERTGSYTLTIKAHEYGDSSQSATVTLTVTVTDENDNIPQCSPSPFVHSESEPSAAPTTIETLVCTDADVTVVPLTYTITVGDTSVFQMSTSVLQLITVVDYDSAVATRSYDLTIQVSDGPNQVDVSGRVNVVPFNEHDPTFTMTTYTANQDEDLGVGSLVQQVTATDDDSSDTADGKIIYSFVSSYPHFSINPNTGEIFLAQALDWDTAPSHTLLVTAEDAATIVTATVSVIVGDINDNAPVFSAATYTTSVSESVGANAAVYTVSATDADDPSTPDGTVTYLATIGGDPSNQFAINSVTGAITTTAVPLDASANPTYTLIVRAADNSGGAGSLTGSAIVLVTVTAVNQYDPAFTPSASYSASPSESDSIGTTLVQVVATDQDGDTVTFSMADHSMFSLDSDGWIRIKAELDFETQATSYTFDVIATDDGSPTRSATAAITITVSDANDNTALCTPSVVSVQKREDAAAVTPPTVATLSCVDSDSGSNANLVYQIVSVNNVLGTGDFAVTATGVVTVSALDYETADVLEVAISVADQGTTPRSTTVSLTLTLTDVNEAAPDFTGDPYSVNVGENSGVGSTIVTVVATDADTSETVTYSLSDTSYLSVDPNTGDIRLMVPFDYETVSPTYTVDVVAVDSNSVDVLKSTTASLTVTITDVNDNDPVFNPGVYAANVDENESNGVTVKTVTATDADTLALGGTISFSIVSGDPSNVFRVDLLSATTGSVVVDDNSNLNYELTTEYPLIVQASDGGGRTASCQVVVRVNNLNEHTPTFTPGSSATTLAEDTATNLPAFATITAADADTGGGDGDVTYSFHASSVGAAPFSLDPNTGAVSLIAKLDRETSAQHVLIITATDGGTGNPAALSSTYVLTIDVTDVNDVTPSCPSDTYAGSVAEDATVTTSVGTITGCSDGDVDAINNVLTYSITGGNTGSEFQVDSATGLVTVLTPPLDREITPQYTLELEVTDTATAGKLTTIVTMSITVTDTNDKIPVFSLPGGYSFSVAEDSPLFHSLGAVSATDDDIGSNAVIAYNLESATPTAGMFSVDATSGDVKVISTLDYETQVTYELIVTATDQATPFNSESVTVTVTVTDVDDESPICPMTYTTNVAESTTPPASIFVTVVCSDVDTTGVTYSLTHALFRVNGVTDAVEVYSALDFETAQSHTLHVVASDGVNVDSTAVVLVKVTAVNEFDPVFAPTTPYTASIAENSSPGTTIKDVDATDQDIGDPDLSFSITGGDPGSLFSINSASGIIVLVGSLDRETAAIHSLSLEVTDGTRTATTGLVITVTDVNDNDPACSQETYLVDVAEGVTGVVETVSCTDADSSTPTLLYSLVGGNTGTVFSIDSSTGELSVSTALDYETLDSYVLVVEVDDQGTSARTTTVTVRVRVTPVNEDDPTFPSASYANTDVAENAAVGHTVITVSADDTDTGLLHGTVRYVIASGDPAGQFLIDTSTGVITVAKALDRETTSSYTLVVRASDDQIGSAGVRTGTVNVPITITDINDNSPEFTPTAYTTTILETASVTGTILTVTVTDDDVGTNSDITVTIDSGDPTGRFVIANNADLVLSQPLDYETTQSYSLVLQAVDGGSPPLTSQARVSIDVGPVNEDAPVLTDTSVLATIPEDTPLGTLIYNATATDDDKGSNHGNFIYSILSGDTTSSFVIDANTGELRVFSRLDYDSAPQSYTLVVQAADGTGLTDTLTLSVTLTDVNDHTPQFSANSYSTNLNENVVNGHSVLTVSATDDDSGAFGQITFAITGGSGQTLFSINGATGLVTTSGTIDYEVNKVLYLTITATDGGGLFSTTNLRITILDLNDNTPVLVPHNSAENVAENIVVGTSVAAITGTDADSAANSNNVFYYSLVSADFEVGPATGVITTKVLLDREANPSGHVLEVVATDQGTTPSQNTATATVTVILTDVNDNDPVITGTYDVTIAENTTQNFVVFRISATDADIDNNGRLTYSIPTGNTNTDFRISSASGLVQVAKVLDRETTDIYNLVIQVSDNGATSRTVLASATVTISDVNDNDPVFSAASYLFSVAENSGLDVEAGTVAATDADIGLNANLIYSLEAFWAGDNTHFVIDGAGGQVKTAVTTLDRETQDTYHILCRVVDQGSPQLYANVNVTIDITDVNDNPPVFNATTYSGTVNENSATSTTVLTVVATDADIGTNADITFSIDTSTAGGVQADTYLQVDPTTGEITVKANIDFETIQTFTFDVKATDGGATPLSDVATVTVTVVDLNDNDPAFTAATLFINTEVAYAGQCSNVAAQPVCNDVDSGNNGVTACYIEASHSYAYLFSVDGPSCEVSTKAIAAANSIYSVDVMCRDAGSPNRIAASPSVVRVDTFIPDNQVIVFQLGITRTTFTLQQTYFTSSITAVVRVTYPNAVVRLWCIEEREGTSQHVNVMVYALQDATTDSQANIAVAKVFLSYDNLRSFFTSDAAGTPNSAITGTAWDYFAIEKVSPYSEDSTPWIETAEGIAITTVACFLGAVFLALLTYVTVRCIRKRMWKGPRRRKRNVTKVRSKPKPKNEEDSLPKRGNAKKPPVPASEPAWVDKGGIGLNTAAIAATAFQGYQQKKNGRQKNSPNPTPERKRSSVSPSGVKVENYSGKYPVVNREFKGHLLNPTTGEVNEFDINTSSPPPAYTFNNF